MLEIKKKPVCPICNDINPCTNDEKLCEDDSSDELEQSEDNG